MPHFGKYLSTFTTTKKSEATHTRIGTTGGGSLKIYGGKYCIPPESLTEFYKKYHDHIFGEDGKQKPWRHEFLTEKQNKTAGPICVDLDFRYPFEIDGEEPKRQHGMDEIQDIVCLYLDKLAELIVFTPNSKFPIFIFEKPNVNQIEKKKGEGETKDGIHIILGIHMDRIIQRLLREKVKKDFHTVVDTLTNLKTDCDADKILDEGITKAQVNWQLYGSRKPNHEAYELVQYIEAECGEEVNGHGDIELNAFDKGDWPTGVKLLKLVSAQNTTHIEYNMKPENQEIYDEMKKSKKKKSKNNVRISNKNYAEGIDIESLKKELEKRFKKWDGGDKKGCGYHILREAHDYTMALSSGYYTDYSKWIRVGWALHNTDDDLFYSWMLFSAQWEHFSYDTIGKNLSIWRNMKKESLGPDGEGQNLTYRSIMYWLRKENYLEWERIRKQTLDYWFESAIKSHKTHDPLALLLKKMYGDTFVCANIEKNIWYEFGWKMTYCI